MIDSEGGKTVKRDEKSMAYGSRSLYHHLNNLVNHNKVIIWMVLLVLAADLSIVLHRSAYRYEPSLPSSQDSKGSFPSQYFSTEQTNISSLSQDNSALGGDLSSPKSNISSPTHDDSTVQSPVPSPTGSVPQVQSSTTDSVQAKAPSPVSQDSEETKLERVLNKAANVNKTVIFTTVNAPWMAPGSLFELFLEGFKAGNQTEALLKHLVVVAVDEKAYSRCLEVHQHCYALKTEGVDFSARADYMSPEYLKMMWRRLDFMRTILKLGYSYVFTDTDIVWFRDPFPRFYAEADFQIACDAYRGNSTDLNNSPNGGFMYARSNDVTIQFFDFWYNSKETFNGKNEQDVLNRIKFDPFLQKIGLKFKFLDTAYFGGFCQPSRDLNLVCTMHANCCTSLDSKMSKLHKLIDDWNNYKASPRNGTERPTWTIRKFCW